MKCRGGNTDITKRSICMRRIILAAFLIAAVSTLAMGQRGMGRHRVRQADDKEELGRLVREWADAVVRGDLQTLDRIEADNFKGSFVGKKFDKRMLREALRSGVMKVAGWTIADVKVIVSGNSAVVTGRSNLTGPVYMGQDFSGEYEWTDRFVRQKDGSWRAVSSHSKRFKKE
ncbi:MAG: nuclear transport factor 2 family protein [Acidobacteria bacterium]|nr:nuclear transport factor 2 family protein [Acidobacteriota bacterium]